MSDTSITAFAVRNRTPMSALSANLSDPGARELDVRRVDLSTPWAGEKSLTEEAARDLRYDALRRMLQEWQGDLIAAGHTMDDQAETVVMRLLRGAGLTGLGGIRTRSGEIVRPFLRISRVTIVAELQRLGLGYRLDSSNLDRRFLRNRIRHEVIPMLSNVQEGLPAILARTAETLQRDADFLDMEIERAAGLITVTLPDGSPAYSRTAFGALHPALQAGLLRSSAFLALPSGTRLSYETVERLQDALPRPAPPAISPCRSQPEWSCGFPGISSQSWALRRSRSPLSPRR